MSERCIRIYETPVLAIGYCYLFLFEKSSIYQINVGFKRLLHADAYFQKCNIIVGGCTTGLIWYIANNGAQCNRINLIHLSVSSEYYNVHHIAVKDHIVTV